MIEKYNLLNLTHLTLRYYFNQSIEQCNFPELIHLHSGYHFNLSIKQCNFPLFQTLRTPQTNELIFDMGRDIDQLKLNGTTLMSIKNHIMKMRNII
jgi:hypothetical protein